MPDSTLSAIDRVFDLVDSVVDKTDRVLNRTKYTEEQHRVSPREAPGDRHRAYRQDNRQGAVFVFTDVDRPCHKRRSASSRRLDHE